MKSIFWIILLNFSLPIEDLKGIMNFSPQCREVFGMSFTNTFIMYFTSLLYIETADRPGLLVEIMKIIADVNVDVESAEIDTEVFFLVFLSHSLHIFTR